MTTKTKRKLMPPPFSADDQVLEIPRPEALSQAEAAASPLPWLTLETLLYALLFVAALALRLYHLDLYPLSDAEAAQSLPALQLYRGLPLGTDTYSPLLLSLNGVAFLLLGMDDFTARLAPALLGCLIVILPVTLRRQLGSRVCLVTSALLALSPTAIFLSRSLDSQVGLAAGALLLVAGFFNWAEDGRQRWLIVAAIGLALLLTAGPMVFSVAIVFGLIILIKYSAIKALWARGFDRAAAQAAPQPDDDDLTPSPPAETEAKDDQLPSSTLHPPSSTLHPSLLRRAGIFFLVSLVLLATAGLFNLSGLSVISGFLPDWLSRFSLQGRPDAGFNAVFLLTIYEPLLVLAGLAGLAYAILEKDLLKQTLGGWFVGLIILDLVMIGRPNGNIILPLVPLAFLAAVALAELWQGLQAEGSWGNEGLLLAAGLVISAFSYIGLTSWLTRTCAPEDTICQYVWVQPIASFGLLLVIAVFFGFLTQAGVAARGLALTGVAVGLMAALSIGWRLNFGPLMDLAYQPLAGIPASTGLVALTETLTRQSAERTGGQITALDTTLAGVNSPSLLWRLRDFESLSQVNSAAEAAPTTAIITPVTVELGMDQPYLGQAFALDALWSPVGLEPKQLVNWLIYRQGEPRPEGNEVILWLRPEEN